MLARNIARSLCARSICACLLALAAYPACAQRWEFGAGAGGSFYTSKSVGGASQAEAGLKTGMAAAGWLGHYNSRYVGGEIRYQFEKNDLKVSAGGGSFAFPGQSHAIGYDLHVHFAPAESKTRPYVLVGGGVKNYRGTGKEAAAQPLSEFAILTRTHQWLPMASFGGGIKYSLTKNAILRIEVRDQMTRFPDEVIAPGRGRKLDGWIHNIVPMVGISYLY